MLNVVTLVWGILAVAGMFVAFIPCLGSLNWVNIPFAIVGSVIGIVNIAGSRNGASRAGILGLVLCTIAGLFGMMRLALGHGII